MTGVIQLVTPHKFVSARCGAAKSPIVGQCYEMAENMAAHGACNSKSLFGNQRHQCQIMIHVFKHLYEKADQFVLGFFVPYFDRDVIRLPTPPLTLLVFVHEKPR